MKNNNLTISAIIISSALIIAAFILAGNNNNQNNPINKDYSEQNNVSVNNGKQIIDITAKGGYQPRNTVAKSGIPTILRFKTQGDFDCSSSIRIPSLGISKALTPSGISEIDIGTPEKGKLNGTCGMGMYSFEINFQ